MRETLEANFSHQTIPTNFLYFIKEKGVRCTPFSFMKVDLSDNQHRESSRSSYGAHLHPSTCYADS